MFSNEKRFASGRGFTIIELLAVVAIIGIVSAIALVNYLGALNKARQRQSIADIREMAMAWERYAIDHDTYQVSAAYQFPSGPVSFEDLEAALVPAHARKIYPLDGWGNPYDLAFDGTSYAIRCRGRDGKIDDSYESPDLNDIDTDLVFSQGQFVIYPSY